MADDSDTDLWNYQPVGTATALVDEDEEEEKGSDADDEMDEDSRLVGSDKLVEAEVRQHPVHPKKRKIDANASFEDDGGGGKSVTSGKRGRPRSHHAKSGGGGGGAGHRKSKGRPAGSKKSKGGGRPERVPSRKSDRDRVKPNYAQWFQDSDDEKKVVKVAEKQEKTVDPDFKSQAGKGNDTPSRKSGRQSTVNFQHWFEGDSDEEFPNVVGVENMYGGGRKQSYDYEIELSSDETGGKKKRGRPSHFNSNGVAADDGVDWEILLSSSDDEAYSNRMSGRGKISHVKVKINNGLSIGRVQDMLCAKPLVSQPAGRGRPRAGPPASRAAPAASAAARAVNGSRRSGRDRASAVNYAVDESDDDDYGGAARGGGGGGRAARAENGGDYEVLLDESDDDDRDLASVAAARGSQGRGRPRKQDRPQRTTDTESRSKSLFHHSKLSPHADDDDDDEQEEREPIKLSIKRRKKGGRGGGGVSFDDGGAAGGRRRASTGRVNYCEAGGSDEDY